MNPPVVSSSPGIAGFALHHQKAILVVILILCVWGAAAVFIMPAGIYPDVAFPRIVIIAERGVDSVENMMIGVTRPVEEAVNAVPGLTRVRSRTIRGGSEFSLDFSPQADMREAVSQTRARIASLLPELPAGLTTIIEQQTPSVFPVISFNVSLDPSQHLGLVRDGADLALWAENDLKPRLSRLKDVFMVSVQGASQRQIIVEPDPRRLAETRVSLSDLVQIIQDSNDVSAVGLLERDYKQYQLLAAHELLTLDEIAALPVITRAGKTIHLFNVAKVYSGLADPVSIVTGEGKDAVVVSLFMRFNGKITDLSDRVNGVLMAITPTLPPGVGITPVYDQAMLVRESLGGVRDAILIGMLLSIAVLWIFLGSWRFTLIAGIAIPISVLATFAILSVSGQSMNLMSLGGVAVAIGLIIDDAIVVVENIARRMTPAAARRGSVIEATREIVGAVVGSSLTTVVVFIPLVLLEGIVGQFFLAMAIALAVGILVSMLVSLTLTPILSAGRMGPRPGETARRGWMTAIAGAYERCIRALLRRHFAAFGLLGLAAGLGILSVIHPATGFLPSMDEGGFVLDYFMPVGTSLSETDVNCRKIEALLAQVPEIKSFSRRTGLELGFFVTEQFTGDFLVALKPLGERRRSTEEVVDELRGRINREVPQIEVSFVQIMQDTINDLAGNPAPVEVKIFGNEYTVIQSLAGRIVRLMETVPGLVDISPGVSYGSPEMTYQLDAETISRAGLTPAEVRRQLGIALLGEEATRLRRANYLVPVVVRYGDEIRRDPAWLAQVPLFNGAGAVLPASSLSRITEKINVNELARENQQPLVSIEANISGRDLGSIAGELRGKLAEVPLPSSVRLELGGQVESQEKAFRNLMMVLTLAAGLVFLLLVAQFRSYRLPAVIFLTIPFSQIGGLLALRLTGFELNIAAFMGLIMLIGLVVKNGIILIEYTAQLRAGGELTLLDALAVAGRVRLRPVLMTSLTAVMALLPLALNIGSGAELQRPLAVAVIGGLSVSTLFTLIVIPVAHLLLGEPKCVRSSGPGVAS
ncbi:MAG: efflux RND transporter permease subunit [bacterium]